MANETAEVAGGNEVSEVFNQAFRAVGDSLKVAMKAQEDTLKFWSEAVSKVNPSPVAGEWLPAAQQNAEEYLRLLETSYRRNAELLKKVMQNPSAGEAARLEKRTSEWLEASMAAARENAQDLAETNMRVAQAWTEALRKGARQVAEKAAK